VQLASAALAEIRAENTEFNAIAAGLWRKAQ